MFSSPPFAIEFELFPVLGKVGSVFGSAIRILRGFVRSTTAWKVPFVFAVVDTLEVVVLVGGGVDDSTFGCFFSGTCEGVVSVSVSDSESE